MSECLFCKINAGEMPASFVYQDEVVTAFLDIQPVNPGHLLVVPRTHAESMSCLSATTAKHMMEVAQRLMDVLRETSIPCEGVNLLLADGEAAGQEVDHVHLHVIPRFNNDGFGFQFGPDYGTLPKREELEEIAVAIREIVGDA